jgi:predicted transcriptional regulator
MPTKPSHETTLKKGARRAAGAKGAAPRKASIKLTTQTVNAKGALKLTTTVRLEPRVSQGLKMLQVLTNRPANKILNEALKQYIDRRTASTEASLEAVLARLREYRLSDPGFRKAISAFVDAEATLGKSDPAEGTVITEEAGPAVTAVRDLLRA